jgi:terminase small subunit / prophage DNA-packing protein
MKTNNDPVLSASMLAGRWGVTSRTVTDLAKRGIAVAAPGGGYYERESTRKYIESLRKTAAGRSGISDERLRLVKAQARILERKNEVAADKYFLKTEALREFTASLIRLRGYLMAVPDRVSQRLSHLTRRDVDEIKKEVAAALYDAAKEELIFTDCTQDEAAEILGPHPEGEKK